MFHTQLLQPARQRQAAAAARQAAAALMSQQAPFTACRNVARRRGVRHASLCQHEAAQPPCCQQPIAARTHVPPIFA